MQTRRLTSLAMAMVMAMVVAVAVKPELVVRRGRAVLVLVAWVVLVATMRVSSTTGKSTAVTRGG